MYAELLGLETVCLRYFNVYGPRQRSDSAYAAVVPLFIEALRNGSSPTVHGDGEQYRDFTYVSDAVAANLLAASAPAERCSGRVYNVGAGRTTTLLALLDTIGRVLGVEPKPVHDDARPGDVKRSRADISAARADLGYEPAVELEAGLRLTIAGSA